MGKFKVLVLNLTKNTKFYIFSIIHYVIFFGHFLIDKLIITLNLQGDMMTNSPTGSKKNFYTSDSHPKFDHLYELLKATCPPGYLEQQSQLQHLKKDKLQLYPEIVEIIPGLFLGN